MRELPGDVLHLIFDNLPISDLLHVTEANDAFVQPAIWSFRHLYAHRTVEINGRLFTHGEDEQLLFVTDKGTIEVRSYELTLKILNTFVDVLEKLEINYSNMHPTEMVEIQRIVREKYANNLKHFGVSHGQSNHPDLIPSIFPNVESVKLLLMRFDNDIRLDEKFPQMQSLNLAYISTKTDDLVDHHFPHLNEFKVHFCDSMYGLNEAQVERMLQKNPQIKYVIVKGGSQNFLKILHENLPNIESLELDDIRTALFSQNDRVIHFAHVKKFTLHMIFKYFINPEHFPFSFGDKLEELELVWFCGTFSPRWVEFIESFANIPKLSVKFLGKCHLYSHIAELSLPKLREIRLQNINLRGFRDFFNRIKQRVGLETIHLIGLGHDETEQIRNEINSEWKMNVFKSVKHDGRIDVVLSKLQFD